MQTASDAARHPASQPASQPARQAANQPNIQTAKQPADQRASQPANPLLRHCHQRTCRQGLGNETTVEGSQGLTDLGVTLRAYWIKSGVTSWLFHGNPDVILYCP